MGSNSTQSKLRGQARLLRSNVIAHRTKQIQAQKKTKLRIGGIKIVKTRKKKKKKPVRAAT